MRSENDWRALAKAESECREPKGTYARLRAEEVGLSLPDPVVEKPSQLDDLKRLAELAGTLGVDSKARVRLKELTEAAEKAEKATAELARREAVFEQYKAAELARLEQARVVHQGNLEKEGDRARDEIAAQRASWKSKMREFLDVAEKGTAA